LLQVIQPHVPQLEVLARASAFVTHGGMNSVSESLYHGVPLVTIPQVGEQEIVSRRVEELGAGVYLAKTAVSADRLRSSVRRVLAEPAFREAAARTGASFKTAGGVQAGAKTILSFTRQAAASHSTG
jgi:MGT family glycosyltransferase